MNVPLIKSKQEMNGSFKSLPSKSTWRKVRCQMGSINTVVQANVMKHGPCHNNRLLMSTTTSLGPHSPFVSDSAERLKPGRRVHPKSGPALADAEIEAIEGFQFCRRG